MTIALAMIVKDEAQNLVRCFDAAASIVQSVVLVDTGSTDGTQDIARDWAKKSGVPLVLHEERWQNFRENRSSLLRHAAEEADWLLMLDCDMVVHAPEPFPGLEGADCWHGRVGFAGLDYTLPMLVRASKPWRYEGVAHSYLACDEPFDESELEGLWVEDYSHTGIAKLERDLDLLSAEHARRPLDARTTFYLAQTYFDLDRFGEAIQFYRSRAYMTTGWDEETYYASYRLGCLLCEHVSFSQGARELLRAWEMRPGRAEALRVLANVANNVGDKIPYPADRLFVHRNAYREPDDLNLANGLSLPAMPPFPPLAAAPRRKPRITRRRGLNPRDVAAVVVTRGNVDLAPILETIPFDEVVVWNNAERPCDYKAFGRYAAIPETTRPVIFWVDDDVLFTAHDALLAAYEPGRLVCNMDDDWIDGAGYRDRCGMQGAGSLCDATLPAEVFERYLAAHPWDDDCLTEADFVFGTLVPFTVVDLGYTALPYADGPDRLYTTPGQTVRKHAMIDRCLTLLPTIEADPRTTKGVMA